MIVIKPKVKCFIHLKDECELITKVAQEIKESNSPYSLIKNVFDIKRALTNLQVVAREFRKDWKVDLLKTYEYYVEKFWSYSVREEHFNKKYSQAKKTCFYSSFQDLTAKCYLDIIQEASRKLSNRCLKIYRDKGFICAKKYCSLFRAIEQQTKRLELTLAIKVKEIKEGKDWKNHAIINGNKIISWDKPKKSSVNKVKTIKGTWEDLDKRRHEKKVELRLSSIKKQII